MASTVRNNDLVVIEGTELDLWALPCRPGRCKGHLSFSKLKILMYDA